MGGFTSQGIESMAHVLRGKNRLCLIRQYLRLGSLSLVAWGQVQGRPAGIHRRMVDGRNQPFPLGRTHSRGRGFQGRFHRGPGPFQKAQRAGGRPCRKRSLPETRSRSTTFKRIINSLNQGNHVSHRRTSQNSGY